MIEGKSNLRKWGNSFAIRISKEKLSLEKIKLNDEIRFIISKKPTKVKDIFGKLKFKTPTDKILGQIDKELW